MNKSATEPKAEVSRKSFREPRVVTYDRRELVDEIVFTGEILSGNR